MTACLNCGHDTPHVAVFVPKEWGPGPFCNSSGCRCKSNSPGTHVLAYGSPTDGLTLIGPITPNDPALEEWIDRNLRGEYWWYLPVQAPEFS